MLLNNDFNFRMSVAQFYNVPFVNDALFYDLAQVDGKLPIYAINRLQIKQTTVMDVMHKVFGNNDMYGISNFILTFVSQYANAVACAII